MRNSLSSGPARLRRATLRAWPVAAALLVAACSPSSEELYQRAEQALAAGKYRAAMIDLQNLVQKEPDNARARAALGLVLLEMGDVDGAAVEVGKARTASADQNVWIVPHCRVLVAQGSYEKALEECSPEQAGEPVRAQLFVAYGGAQLGLQDYARARQSFEAALAANPGDLESLQGLASATFAAQGVAAARTVLGDAAEQVKAQPRYWLTVGGFELRAGEYALAEQSFQTALERMAGEEKHPDRLPALAGLAESQVRQNKSKEATATSELLLAAAPKSTLAKFVRAQAAIVSGDLAQARTSLEEVVTADPRNGRARTMLGYVNLQQGNLGQAQMHLQAVVAAEPDNWLARRMLAETRTRQQQPDEALKVLQSGAADPQAANPALLAMAGRLSLASGDRAGGLEMLERAAAGSQGDPELALELAGGFLMAGDVDKAIEAIESLPETSNATGYQREYVLMLALIAKGDQAAAITRAQELTRTRGYDPKIRNLVGAMYASLGRTADARKEFEAAIKAEPNAAPGYLNVARLEIADRNWEAATKRLDEALAKDPESLQASLGKAAVAAAQRDRTAVQKWLDKAIADHPDSVQARLALGQFHLQSGEITQARELAANAVKLAPNDAAVANFAGVAAASAGDLDSAVAEILRAIKLAPNAASYPLNLARIYLMRRDYPAAMKIHDEQLARDPDNYILLTRAAITAFAAGQDAKGDGYVERMRKIAPDSSVTKAMLGDVALRKQQPREALRYYDRAFELAPSSTLAINRYRAGVAAGVASPESPLTDWLRRNPDDLLATVALGEHYQERGDLDAAVRQYEKALKGSPDNPAVLNNLAYVMLLRKDPRAVEVAAKAYEGLPQNPAVQDTYGLALVRSGSLDRGVELLRRAASALPGNAEVQLHLAEALLQAKQPAEARTVLNRVINGDASAASKDAARELLGQAGV
jgi:putative PEP-CTERM system TPR-repeat lipoprotein